LFFKADKYMLTPSGLFVNVSKNDTSDAGFYTCLVENKLTDQKRESKSIKLIVVPENGMLNVLFSKFISL